MGILKQVGVRGADSKSEVRDASDHVAFFGGENGDRVSLNTKPGDVIEQDWPAYGTKEFILTRDASGADASHRLSVTINDRGKVLAPGETFRFGGKKTDQYPLPGKMRIEFPEGGSFNFKLEPVEPE